MLNLLPFRVSRFSGENCDRIQELFEIGRQDSDRSQFVRFAKMTQTWLQWVQDGTIVETEDEIKPEDDEFEYGIARLDDLSPSQSVIPAEKESAQRVLEALSVCLTPIVVDHRGLVLDQHVAYHASKGLQSELARPGRVRASDFALVARAKAPHFSNPKLQIISTVDPVLAMKQLEQLGFTEDRSDVPIYFSIEFGYKKLYGLLSNINWQTQIETVFGIRKLDLNLKPITSAEKSLEQFAIFQVETNDRISENNDFPSLYPAPAGSIALDKRPKIGHIMWSSRRFPQRTK
jgi:hypothetical protein